MFICLTICRGIHEILIRSRTVRPRFQVMNQVMTHPTSVQSKGSKSRNPSPFSCKRLWTDHIGRGRIVRNYLRDLSRFSPSDLFRVHSRPHGMTRVPLLHLSTRDLRFRVEDLRLSVRNREELWISYFSTLLSEDLSFVDVSRVLLLVPCKNLDFLQETPI